MTSDTTLLRDGSVQLPRPLMLSVENVMRDSQTMMREWCIRLLAGENGNGEDLRNHMREIASYHGLTIEDFSSGDSTTSVEVTFVEIPPHYNPNCIMLKF